MRIGYPLTATLAALFLWNLTGSSASAARNLKATIELDGTVVLSSTYFGPDRTSPAKVWRYLSKEPSSSVEFAPLIKANPARPLRLDLNGAIAVRFRFGNRTIAEVTASKLTLVRASPTSDRWFLPGEEVERLAKSNGIPNPPLVDFPEFLETFFGSVQS
jgi:hypothetical protein